MPLSICVILRIYNEDAIHVSFLLLTGCTKFVLSRSSSFSPLPLRLSPSSSLSHLDGTESTQVPSSSLPSLRSANRRMSWCLTMVIIAVPPRTMQFCEEGDNSNGDFVHHYESAFSAWTQIQKMRIFILFFIIFQKKSNHLDIKIDNKKVFLLNLQ